MSVTLPPQIFDQIIDHIGNFPDVLSVALSNKTLYSIVVPKHLHYRDVRSRLHNPTLWSWLSHLNNPRTTHIRSLTILPDKQDNAIYETSPPYDLRERLPAELAVPEDLLLFSRVPEASHKSEARLIPALIRMSKLQSFRWYHTPGPILKGAANIWSTLGRLGTIKEVAVFDGPVYSDTFIPIALSNTFLCFGNFTSLKLRSFVCKNCYPDKPKIPQLEQMLLNNCPDLEILELELHLSEDWDGTANIDHLLGNALWPNLRILRLRGVNCRVPELARFLIAHPSLEELALARMMPGPAWPRLELPADALPNLRHLECSSAQAAALLKNKSTRPLKTLLGIEVHDNVINSDYFSIDDEWEDEIEDEDCDDFYKKQPSPWKAAFLKGLRAQNSITCLGVVSIDSLLEMVLISTVAPQVRELRIRPQGFSYQKTEWPGLNSLFPALEVLSD